MSQTKSAEYLIESYYSYLFARNYY